MDTKAVPKGGGKEGRPYMFDIRYILYVLLAVIPLFYVLPLVGCLTTSPIIPRLFLVELESNQTVTVNVKVGYYGMCMPSSAAGGALKCAQTYSQPAENLTRLFVAHHHHAAEAETDDFARTATRLLSAAHTIQTRIFSPLLAASGGLFFLCLVCLVVLKTCARPRDGNGGTTAQSRKRLRSALSVTRQYAFGLAVASAFSTNQATGALSYVATALHDPGIGQQQQQREESSFSVRVGVPVQGLQWTVVALLVVFHLSASVLLPPAGAAEEEEPPAAGGPDRGISEWRPPVLPPLKV
ncbi:hypothetical protein GGR56DRAFT_669055 [Xylariaceae sp. FL0804]|nr:hypothetical protein GGR56DRAFT_669055 [Xylariaceae sp. FL0804]